jgi:hypothetical protein
VGDAVHNLQEILSLTHHVEAKKLLQESIPKLQVIDFVFQTKLCHQFYHLKPKKTKQNKTKKQASKQQQQQKRVKKSCCFKTPVTSGKDGAA